MARFLSTRVAIVLSPPSDYHGSSYRCWVHNLFHIGNLRQVDSLLGKPPEPFTFSEDSSVRQKSIFHISPYFHSLVRLSSFKNLTFSCCPFRYLLILSILNHIGSNLKCSYFLLLLLIKDYYSAFFKNLSCKCHFKIKYIPIRIGLH